MLREVVVYMAHKVAGPEAGILTHEVLSWIAGHLEPGYPWPGNYRELEQCVKNVLIRRDYRPSRSGSADGSRDPINAFADDLRFGRLTADQVLSRYCTIVYSQTGSYEETARRIQLDRRTVKSKIDQQFAAQLQGRE